jgi:L-threonylcarbamoyladenylate synthase
MAIFEATEENLSKAAEVIRSGDLVAFATETVYGLGANALNANACEKIFAAKKRPHFDPLIVHIASIDQLDSVAAEFPEKAKLAAAKFWPGPLTIVLRKNPAIPDLITSGLPTVAVRIPAHPVAKALLEKLGLPIAAPSANPFGYLSPTTALHVEEQLGDSIPMILEGGDCDCGLESTIVDFSQAEPVLLRHGGIPLEEIVKVCGPVKLGQAVLDKPLAPGQLHSHYSPNTPLVILKNDELPDPKLKYGLLTHSEINNENECHHIEKISSTGNLKEAAHNLFSALHRLDELELEIIYAYEFPEHGLGSAIMDRLRKAAAKRQ